jgi:Cu(I)/Ag(I) efflux system membrane fusion protein
MKKIILIATVLCLLAAGVVVAETVDRKMTVQGMCGMCKTRIEKTALGIDGVTRAEWDIDTKVLTLQFDSAKTKLEAISAELAKVGHDTDRDKADDKVYNALPPCCKYR